MLKGKGVRVLHRLWDVSSGQTSIWGIILNWFENNTKIANQCLWQKVNGFLGCVRKEGWERALLADRQCTYIIAWPTRCYGVEFVEARSTCEAIWIGADGRTTDELTNHVQNEIKLMTVISAWEQWSSRQQFSQDATHCPDINCLQSLARVGVIQSRTLPSCTSWTKA